MFFSFSLIANYESMDLLFHSTSEGETNQSFSFFLFFYEFQASFDFIFRSFQGQLWGVEGVIRVPKWIVPSSILSI